MIGVWGGDVSATAEKAAKRRRKCERRKEIAVAPMSFIASPKNAQGGEGLEHVHLARNEGSAYISLWM